MRKIKNILRAVKRRGELAFSPEVGELYDLASYAKKFIVPPGISLRSPDSFVPEQMLSEKGIDYKVANQIEMVRRWGRDYKDFFQLIREDPKINIEYLGKPYLHNRYYPTPDAEIYASMIIDRKPKKIIEIGSGFSTLIARRTIDKTGINCRLEVIDPQPRTDITAVADRVSSSYVEKLSIGEIEIDECDILFIDSSHICRTGGDIPYIYCKLIPNLPSGVVIHVHDIYLPYDYPLAFQKKLFTEQYVLYSLLSDSTRYEVLLASHLLSRKHSEEMQKAISPIIGLHDRFYGGALWFQIK